MKQSFDTGNFTIEVEGEFSPEQQEKANKAALAYILQRDGASKAYVELAGVKNSKGKLQLPADFERDSLEYSEENAARFQDAFGKAMAPYGTFTVTDVKERVKGEAAAPSAMATAMWEQAKAETDPALRSAYQANLGVPLDSTDEVGVEAAKNFFAKFRKPRK